MELVKACLDEIALSGLEGRYFHGTFRVTISCSGGFITRSHEYIRTSHACRLHTKRIVVSPSREERSRDARGGRKHKDLPVESSIPVCLRMDVSAFRRQESPAHFGNTAGFATVKICRAVFTFLPLPQISHSSQQWHVFVPSHEYQVVSEGAKSVRGSSDTHGKRSPLSLEIGQLPQNERTLEAMKQRSSACI